MGYYKLPEITKEAVTEEGWLKTGDIAQFFPENKSFKIIDRKKNIFKLQQGEYLAPDRI
jgi:long-chain acyl-CoA synthetase